LAAFLARPEPKQGQPQLALQVLESSELAEEQRQV